VIRNASDLMNFRKGEVLICDSIDPNMTFVVPLASAIIERRGGMLIHGAIIAREYGIPCVTGISRATDVIQSGDRITVDGYLGIVIIDVSSRSDSGVTKENKGSKNT
jgi:pyruvate,water dikinase